MGGGVASVHWSWAPCAIVTRISHTRLQPPGHPSPARYVRSRPAAPSLLQESTPQPTSRAVRIARVEPSRQKGKRSMWKNALGCIRPKLVSALAVFLVAIMGGTAAAVRRWGDERGAGAYSRNATHGANIYVITAYSAVGEA